MRACWQQRLIWAGFPARSIACSRIPGQPADHGGEARGRACRSGGQGPRNALHPGAIAAPQTAGCRRPRRGIVRFRWL